MKLNSLLEETFNVKAADYTDESNITGFAEWDSMNHMIFITRLEEVYGINLTGDEIASMRSVADIKQIIKSKGVSNEAV